MSNKRIVMFTTIVGLTAGSFIPMLWGDNSLLGGWSLIMSFVCGIFGVYIGAQIAKRY